MQLTKIIQTFDNARIEDVAAATGEALAGLDTATLERIAPGKRIAIGAGSRGVANIALVVRTVVAFLKGRGAEVFVVPAMGSHGGATAAGQREVLASYGITEDYVGAPIVSSMEVVRIDPETVGAADLDIPLYMDKHAADADGVVLINRIKPHTDFHGHPESGLMKMSVIGLGKHAQALAVHGMGIRGLKERILPAARALFRTGKILFGVALVENGYDETSIVEAIPVARIEERERELLEVARGAMPSLPIRDIDILFVDEMGKDVSGTGLDTNIIGRLRVPGETEPDYPAIKTIVVDRLTEASHGNAIGVGLADVITRRLYDRIDFDATYENCITSSFLERGKTPLVAENARKALRVALRGAAVRDPEKARVVRIKSTLALSEIYVSLPIADELSNGGARPGVEVTGERFELFAADELSELF